MGTEERQPDPDLKAKLAPYEITAPTFSPIMSSGTGTTVSESTRTGYVATPRQRRQPLDDRVVIGLATALTVGTWMARPVPLTSLLMLLMFLLTLLLVLLLTAATGGPVRRGVTWTPSAR